MEGCAGWENANRNCFHSGFHPLLCHNIIVTIITSTLYPDFNEYLNRDYAAPGISFFHLFIQQISIETHYVLESILNTGDTMV